MPRKWPVLSLGALFLGYGVGIVVWFYQEAEILTPLQRYYWNEYFSTEMYQGQGDYWMLAEVDKHGQHRIATDSDVVPVVRSGHVIPFALSSQARQAGAVDLVVDTFHNGGSEQVHQMLAQRFYHGESVEELSRPHGWLALSYSQLAWYWQSGATVRRDACWRKGSGLKVLRLLQLKTSTSGVERTGSDSERQIEMKCSAFRAPSRAAT